MIKYWHIHIVMQLVGLLLSVQRWHQEHLRPLIAFYCLTWGEGEKIIINWSTHQLFKPMNHFRTANGQHRNDMDTSLQAYSWRMWTNTKNPNAIHKGHTYLISRVHINIQTKREVSNYSFSVFIQMVLTSRMVPLFRRSEVYSDCWGILDPSCVAIQVLA